MMRPKKIGLKITKWIVLVLASALILITVLLSSLRFATPYLQSHNQQIEAWIGGVIGYPVKIDKLEVEYFGLEPVITLNEVAIFDQQRATELFKLHRLSLGIDFIGSLFKRHIEVGLLLIDGTTLELYQTQDGRVHWTILDEKYANNTQDLQSIQDIQRNKENNDVIFDRVSWLFAQGKVVLNDVNVIWRSIDGKFIKLNRVKFRLINGLSYNKIAGRADILFDQQSSSMSFLIKFRGNILENTTLSDVHGKIALSNFTLDLSNVFSSSADASANTSTNEFFTKFFPRVGNVNLYLNDLNLTCDKLWEKPHFFARVAGKLIWQKSNDGQWLLDVNDFKIDNPDLQVDGSLKLSFQTDHKLPICDLALKFNTEFLENFSKYFPDKVLPAGVTHWLNQAFKSGAAAGSIILRGAIDHFPFVEHKDGNFSAHVVLKDVDFNYQNDWPALKHFNGSFDVSGKSMSIVADTAEIADISVYHVTASIPDLVKAVLEVDSQSYFDAQKGLHFLLISPLKDNLGNGFNNVFLQGAMRLKLKLIIPIAFNTGIPLQVFGAVNLNDNNLVLSDWDLTLYNIYGNLDFTENSISGNDIRGVLFSSPINLNVSTDKDGENSQYKVTFNGALDIDKLQQDLQFPFNRYLQGSTDYYGILTIASKKSNSNNILEVNSKLLGIEIYVPPLIKKAENEVKNFKINLSFVDDSPKKDILLNYNNELSAAVSFEKINKKNKFISGVLDLSGNSAKITRKNGLFVTANFGKVDWDEWQKLLFSENNFGEIKVIKNFINEIDLQIAELQIWGQTLKDIQLSILPDKQNWDISIQNANIAGNIVVPVDLSKGVLSGKLQRAYLQVNDSKKNKKIISPKGLPNLDFVIDDFHYGVKELGKVVLKANSIATGLNISQLQIVSANFQLDASGKWEQFNGIIKSFLNGKCASKNVGDAFKQLHFTESVKSGVGAANFALEWSGPFYDLDLPSLNGNVSVDIRKGRIVNFSSAAETEMGFGRLLNILSLQTLPRRLSLDFSDLVKGGFSFDILSGTLKFVKGDAFTQDMQLKGPVAEVAVKGRIGFVAKNVDMNLNVVPHLTSSLPVIATVLGTPVVGAGVWLAEKVIGNQVSKAVASYVYRVTGGWANPDIQKL